MKNAIAAPPIEEQATGRALSAIEEAVSVNPYIVLRLNPDDPTQLLIRPERNTRGTPDVGDKSILNLANNIGELGFNHQPALATIDPATGAADLYAGFKRARAVQTWNRDHPDNPVDLRVMVTDTISTEQQVFEMSLSENAFREDMNLMEKCAALMHLMSPEGGDYSCAEAGRRMNLSKAEASILARCEFLPNVAKKALVSGKLTYTGAEGLVALLPRPAKGQSLKQMVEADEDGSGLKEAQDKIAKLVTKQLEATGKVRATDVDTATRKTAGADGKVANKTQRASHVTVKELKAWLEAQEEGSEDAAIPRVNAVLKFIGGGTMKALIKGLQ